MYKVKKEFTDQLKNCFRYKVGDAYEEKSPIWTDYLVKQGCIEKVSFLGKKNEVVQEKQD